MASRPCQQWWQRIATYQRQFRTSGTTPPSDVTSQDCGPWEKNMKASRKLFLRRSSQRYCSRSVEKHVIGGMFAITQLRRGVMEAMFWADIARLSIGLPKLTATEMLTSWLGLGAPVKWERRRLFVGTLDTSYPSYPRARSI